MSAASDPRDPVRVLIAHPDPEVVRDLAVAIGCDPRLDLVGAAADGFMALARIDRLEPDVALLATDLPGLAGAEVCRLLTPAPAGLSTRVVVVVPDSEPRAIAEAVAEGAAGAIAEDDVPEAVCAAVHRVARGGAAFGEDVREGVLWALERLFAAAPAPR